MPSVTIVSRMLTIIQMPKYSLAVRETRREPAPARALCTRNRQCPLPSVACLSIARVQPSTSCKDVKKAGPRGPAHHYTENALPANRSLQQECLLHRRHGEFRAVLDPDGQTVIVLVRVQNLIESGPCWFRSPKEEAFQPRRSGRRADRRHGARLPTMPILIREAKSRAASPSRCEDGGAVAIFVLHRQGERVLIVLGANTTREPARRFRSCRCPLRCDVVEQVPPTKKPFS